MARRAKPGRRAAGDPARRGLHGTVALTQVLWPFAVDFYADRLVLLGDVPVVHNRNGTFLKVPRLGLIGVKEDVTGLDTVDLVALLTSSGNHFETLLVNADGFDAAVDRLLFDLTSMFLDEVGAGVQQVTAGRLAVKPELADEQLSREAFVGLIVRAGDPERVQKFASYNPPPG